MLSFFKKAKTISAYLMEALLIVLLLAGVNFISKKTDLKEIPKLIKEELSVLAQELEPFTVFFFPTYPDRLKYLAIELSGASEELVFLNEELKKSLESCSCSNTRSQCAGVYPASCSPGQVKVYSEPCPQREEIGEKQKEAGEKAEQILFLRNLLLAEMETGLERELSSLGKEEAQELRAALEQILTVIKKPSQEIEIENEDLYSLGIGNSALPSNCSLEGCAPACQLGVAFRILACMSIGEQKPLIFKFKVGLGLTDLELGEVRIKNVNLGLADFINISRLGKLSLKIPSQQFTISFPPQDTMPEISGQSYNLSGPQIFLPEVPDLTLSCPSFPASSYQCSPEQVATMENTQVSEYFKTFAYLTEQCQNFYEPGCYEEKIAPLKEYYESLLVTCKVAGNCEEIEERIAMLEKEAKVMCSPQGCLNPQSVIDVISDQCDTLFLDPLAEVPEICNEIGGITLTPPGVFNYNNPAEQCDSQAIGDYPSSMLSCSASLPTVPKFRLPTIKIPDIILGEFNLLPFIYVKLPSFVFEDLILPEINLCDLDECSFVFPTLNFDLPSLNIPTIRVPSVKPPGGPEVNMDSILVPPLPFNLSQMPELNLVRLMMPDLELPDVNLPRPRFIFSFEGMDIDIGWAIASFIMYRFQIPTFTACVEWGISLIPVSLIFPDYYFSWPAIPQIGQIPFCRDIDNFCRRAKLALREVTDKVAEIENIVNATLMKGVQANLDLNAQVINSSIQVELQKFLAKISDLIRAELEKSFALARVENGKIIIPPAFIQMPQEVITINLADVLNLSPKIKIPWPERLKKIALLTPFGYDLPDIPLSELSYTETVELHFPGFQAPSFSVNIQFGAECTSPSPGGGNPCPVAKFQENLNKIVNFVNQVMASSQRIINVLE